MADTEKVKRNIKRMIDQGASEQEIDTYLSGIGVTPESLRSATVEPVDSRTGAPANVRALVGGAPPEGRLRTLQGFFPDAAPDPVDPENFIYTDPKSGMKTLYNPRGFQAADLASIAKEGTQAVMSGGGAVLGALAGGPAGAIAGAGSGNVAGEEAFNVTAEQFGMVDPRTSGQRLTDDLFTAAAGAGGEAIGMGAGALVRGATRGLVRGGTRDNMGRVIDEFSTVGAEPTLGQASGKRYLQAVESFFSRMPGGAGVFAKRAEDTISKVKSAIDEKVYDLAPGRVLEPEIAGREIERGIDSFVGDFKGKSEALFNQIDNLIPPGTPVPVSSTRQALADLAAVSPEAPELTSILVNPTIRKLNEALGSDLTVALRTGSDAIPYDVLKRLRTQVGRKLAGNELVSDVPKAELKQLYAALSNDMRAAAQAAGPDAVKAFDRANQFYTAGLDRIENVLQKVVGKSSPEQIYTSLISGGKEGATMIRGVRKSLDPNEWGVVAALTLKRLGRATPGKQDDVGEAFDIERFLTNWNTLSKEAKEAMFGGHPNLSMLKSDLDTIASIASNVKDSARIFANPSGTAGQTVGQTMTLAGLGAGTLAIGGAIGLGQGIPGAGMDLALILGAGALTANASARLMTSPKFVHWLARGTKLEPNGMGAHLGRLGAIIQAEPDPETRDAMMQYLSVFGGMNGDQDQD